MDSNLSNVPAADVLFLELINELGQRMMTGPIRGNLPR